MMEYVTRIKALRHRLGVLAKHAWGWEIYDLGGIAFGAACIRKPLPGIRMMYDTRQIPTIPLEAPRSAPLCYAKASK